MSSAFRIRNAYCLLAMAGIMTATAISSAPGAQPARDVRYVVVHSPGPNWKPGVPFFEQAGVRQHVDHYRKLLDQGKLDLGGPFLDTTTGGMMIPEAGVSEQEIREFANADPAVKSGLLKAEIRQWLLGMKK